MTEIKLEYPDDRTPPIPAAAEAHFDADLTAGGGRVFGLVKLPAYENKSCSAGAPQMTFDNVLVRAGYDSAVAEPGSVILCRDKSWRLTNVGANLKSYRCDNNGAVTTIFARPSDLGAPITTTEADYSLQNGLAPRDLSWLNDINSRNTDGMIEATDFPVVDSAGTKIGGRG